MPGVGLLKYNGHYEKHLYATSLTASGRQTDSSLSYAEEVMRSINSNRIQNHNVCIII